jgi:ABC-type transporter Mla subunit MlaD
MNEQAMRFRIGIFALAALILLGILIMLFGGTTRLIRTQDRYTVVFDYAPGVAPGSPVRRSGVGIGQVEAVDLDDATGKVRVTILIDRPHVLYENDQPVLVHGALSGDTSIDFLPRPPEEKPPQTASPRSDGRPPQVMPVSLLLAQAPKDPARPADQPPGRVPAKPGTEFKGTTQADLAAILKEISSVTPTMQEAFGETSKTMRRYGQMTPDVEETLRAYRDLAKATREMVPEVRRTNDELQVTARNWSKVGERVDVLIQANQEKLVKTLDNLNDTIVRIGRVLNEENQRNLSTALKNVSAGTKDLESIAKNTDELLKESRQTVRRVNDSVTQADQVLANLQQATKPMAQRSDSVMKNLDEGAAKLNQTLTDVQELLRTGGPGDGTLKRLLTDPSLYHNLNDAACMLARLMPRLDRILHDAEVFADKIARHPESLGIGGVVSPSSGLKDAPSSTSYRPRTPGH